MNIKIIKLNIHDYHKCSNIWNMEKQKELSDKFYKEILSGNRAVYIYSIDDEYIAEISLVYNTDDGEYTIPGKRVYVSRLVVKKSFRRRGIGRKLVEFIKTEAENQGFSELSIGVNLDNYAAVRLYASSGFDKIIRIDEDEDGKYAKLLCTLCDNKILEA